jgi:3-hydroxyisobutyrate dehydrogenase-like beta-hydroxyacid dehydrogenase
MDLAFIGIGGMGAPMARNLLAAGHRLQVWNRSASRAAALVEAGATLAASPARAAQAAECAITMLADDAAVEAVTFGPEGLVSGLKPGAIHVSMSTIGADCADRLAAAHADAGQGFVSAPVFGRPQAAAEAQLFVVAAGAPAAIERLQPVFQALGQRSFVVGERPSQANVVKLSGNFMIMGAVEAMAEALTIAARHGVERQAMLEVITGTLFGAPIYRNYGALLLGEQFRPAGFTAELGLKDMRLLDVAAEKARVPAPLLGLVRDRLRSLVAIHGPDIDWAALGKMVSEAAALDAPEPRA